MPKVCVQTCLSCASRRACVCRPVSTCASVHGVSCVDVCVCVCVCVPAARGSAPPRAAWGPKTEGKGKVVQAREILNNFKEKKNQSKPEKSILLLQLSQGKKYFPAGAKLSAGLRSEPQELCWERGRQLPVL